MSITASHVYHVNVNCSDLDRSLAFYRDRLGFTAGAHTAPVAAQPGAAFGLDEVRWDAWIMNGAAGPIGPVIDLLRWLVPEPEGNPQPAGATAFGFTRLHVTSPVPGAADLIADPDGTALTISPGDAVALTGVTIGCRDVARSAEFFADLLGFARRDTGATPSPDGDVWLVDAPGTFTVELRAQPADAVAAAPVANRLGIYRMAMLTDAIDDDHRRLVDAGVRCYSEPATLDMGPGLPILRALFFADPDGATIELIETTRS